VRVLAGVWLNIENSLMLQNRDVVFCSLEPEASACYALCISGSGTLM